MPADIETLLAERDLVDLLARFDDCAIRADLDNFRNLWTEDAIWEIDDPIPMNARGRPAIVDALAALLRQNLFFFRMTGRPLIHIDGGSATLRSTTVELAGRPGNKAYANVALYQDLAIRQTGGPWRFAKRKYLYLWVDTQANLGGQAVALPAGLTPLL